MVLKRTGVAVSRGLAARRPPPPHRISLRLPARLLRLPLQGGNCRACVDVLVGEVAGIGWPPHRISLRLRLGFCDSPSRGATAGLVKMGKGGEVAGIGWPPPTASAFACGSASATPPQGGQLQGLCRCAGGQGGGYWLAPPPHQPSPAARLLRLPLKGGVIPKACIRSSSITPPLRGSRREGGARSRAGGGQTRRPIEPEGGNRGVPSSRLATNNPVYPVHPCK